MRKPLPSVVSSPEQEFTGLPAVEPEEVGFATERLARISQTMDAAVEARAVPGTVTVVLRRGQLVHAHAVGALDMDRETELGMDSLFRTYSQTNP